MKLLRSRFNLNIHVPLFGYVKMRWERLGSISRSALEWPFSNYLCESVRCLLVVLTNTMDPINLMQFNSTSRHTHTMQMNNSLNGAKKRRSRHLWASKIWLALWFRALSANARCGDFSTSQRRTPQTASGKIEYPFNPSGM